MLSVLLPLTQTQGLNLMLLPLPQPLRLLLLSHPQLKALGVVPAPELTGLPSVKLGVGGLPVCSCVCVRDGCVVRADAREDAVVLPVPGRNAGTFHSVGEAPAPEVPGASAVLGCACLCESARNCVAGVPPGGVDVDAPDAALHAAPPRGMINLQRLPEPPHAQVAEVPGESARARVSPCTPKKGARTLVVPQCSLPALLPV